MTNKARKVIWLVFAVVAAQSSARSALSSGRWNPPHGVTIEVDSGSEDRWGSLWSSTPLSVPLREGEPGSLLIRDKDYLIADMELIPYDDSDGTTLTIGSTGWGMTLNKMTVALSLGKPEALEWLAEASEDELAAIRIVTLPHEVDEISLVQIRRLAAANPEVDIVVDSLETLVDTLPLFRTRALFTRDLGIDGYRPDVTEILAEQTELEMLAVHGKDFFSLELLPDLPGLHCLWIDEWDVEATGALPSRLQGLRSLMVTNATGLNDFFPLAGAAGLEELTLVLDEPIDLDGLAGLPELRTLRIWSEVTGISELATAQRIRWLGLPIAHHQLDGIARTYPDLEVLEIFGTDGLIDLSPLGDLTNLDVLVLPHSFDPGGVGILSTLKSLRFVGVSDEKSPEVVAALRRNLPNALVSPVGICLGSGWVLLLIPALLCFWFLPQRRRYEERRA